MLLPTRLATDSGDWPGAFRFLTLVLFTVAMRVDPAEAGRHLIRQN